MPTDPARSPSPPPPGDEPVDGAWLQDLMGTVRGARWLILGTVLAALVLGLLYLGLATPIYRADALIQVEQKKKGITGLEDLPPLLLAASSADTEIELLRSRSLLAQVVKELSLDVVATPRHFPVIGRSISRNHRGPDLGGAPPLLSRFAWGGERIAVDRLTVPPDLEDRKLTLIAQAGGRYRLVGPDGEELLQGEVARAASGSSNGVATFVSELRAHPGTRFLVVKRPELEVIEDLQRDLVIGEHRKKTSILRLELSGPDVEKVVRTLHALSAAYVRQNVERKSAEAEKGLEFITSQLPELKTRVEQSEEALNLYRSTHGTIDVPLETRAAIEKSAAIEKLAIELQQQRAELSQRFTDSHPSIVVIRTKLARLESEQAALNAHIKNLPEAERDSTRLLRDVRVSNELYVLLLNKAQELRVMKSESVGNVRILDPAMAPREPVSPAPGQTIGLALLLGLALGILAALARRLLTGGVDDAAALEAATGLGVYASVPHSPAEARLARAARGLDRPGESGVLARREPADLAVESVRGLRTCLQHALSGARSNVVAVVGPSPAAGTSFIACNLAQVLADSGKRTLLVDGDLRDGRLHRVLGLDRGPGLAEVLGGSDLGGTLHHLAADLDLLTAGRIPPLPSELLMGERFGDLMARASKEYELVVIDTPPLLAVTDAAIISRLAGLTVLVLRAGQHPMGEVALAVRRLSQSGVRPAGIVLNDVRRGASATAYGYGLHGHDQRRPGTVG